MWQNAVPVGDGEPTAWSIGLAVKWRFGEVKLLQVLLNVGLDALMADAAILALAGQQ